jgi:hypothetical protein
MIPICWGGFGAYNENLMSTCIIEIKLIMISVCRLQLNIADLANLTLDLWYNALLPPYQLLVPFKVMVLQETIQTCNNRDLQAAVS